MPTLRVDQREGAVLKPVRIGVDARPLCHPGTGIYRYTSELLQRMVPMGGEWFFYSAHAYDTARFDFPNVQHRIAGIPSFVRASQSAHFFFPIWAKRDRVDTFWGPRHQLPLYLPSSVRAVLTVYDLVWKRFGETMRFPGKQLEAFFMPRALARADHVVAISEFTRGEIESCFPVSREKISIVPCASHIDALRGEQAMDARKVAPYFLFVGTMEPRKNLQRLLRAYRVYIDTCDNPLGLKIVGGHGWGGVETGRMIEELSLAPQVELLGKVADGELGALYSGARALVLPSLYEGFGLPIVESLSQGVPVITSQDSAMSEVAGKAGLLVDPLSESEISAALARMTEEDELHARLVSLTHAESERYDWSQSADLMYRLLSLSDQGAVL